jgi:hypothetical protein
MIRTHTGNTRQRPITVLAMMVLGMLQTLVVAAQPSIEPGAGLGVFSQVESWVRDWDLPSADSPEALSEPMRAVTVTLRLDGRVFGRGSAASADPDRMLVWRAASQAINAANAKLTQDRDAMWEAFIRELSGRIMIGIELGDELIPISQNELELPGFGYSPGSVGFATRLGARADAVGPGSILLKRGDPARSVAALSLTLSEDVNLVMQSPKDLSEQGFIFYRWVPMCIAQPSPGLGGVFLDRGGRAIDSGEISVHSIRSMSDRVAAHLIGRRWEGVEDYGFVGTLDPVTGQAASPFAGAFEQALGAFALLRYGNDAASEAKREAVIAAREILRELTRVEPVEVTPWDDPLASCMIVIALSEVPLELILGDQDLSVLRTNTLQTLDTIYAESGGFDPIIPDAAQGLVAHALVASAKLDPKDRTALASSAISRVYLETPAELLVSQMPFLAWAQMEQGGDGEVPAGSALRQMRSDVWDHQLVRADLNWIDRDLAGGIVFTRSNAPLPSWSALRPLAAVASMLGHEQLTPGSVGSGEVPREIGRLVDSIRFVRQLVAQGETMHMFADAELADWGVRMALWDQRMPIESSAMTLLLLVEASASFDAIMKR